MDDPLPNGALSGSHGGGKLLTSLVEAVCRALCQLNIEYRSPWEGRQTPELKISRFRLTLAVLFAIFGISLLIWNEIEAVRVNQIVTSVIDEIHKVTNPNRINENNGSSLVYIYGNILVEEPLAEPEYGLSVPAVILKRRVQMYQWVEKIDEGNDPGKVSPFDSYYYELEWKDKLIDSSKFSWRDGHENPKKDYYFPAKTAPTANAEVTNREKRYLLLDSILRKIIFSYVNGLPMDFPVKSHTYLSPSVRIGAYILSAELKNMFNDFIIITSDERPERHDIKMHAGLYYHTSDVWNPKVGDIRIQFSYAGNSDEAVSIIAKQDGRELVGGSLLLLEHGKVSPTDMISNAHNWNMWLVRFYRTAGWLSLYCATTISQALFTYFGRKYRKLYLCLSLERRLSAPASVASALTALIVSSVWTYCMPAVGAMIGIAFLSPFLWCAASLADAKPSRGQYKRI